MKKLQQRNYHFSDGVHHITIRAYRFFEAVEKVFQMFGKQYRPMKGII